MNQLCDGRCSFLFTSCIDLLRPLTDTSEIWKSTNNFDLRLFTNSYFKRYRVRWKSNFEKKTTFRWSKSICCLWAMQSFSICMQLSRIGSAFLMLCMLLEFSNNHQNNDAIKNNSKIKHDLRYFNFRFEYFCLIINFLFNWNPSYRIALSKSEWTTSSDECCWSKAMRRVIKAGRFRFTCSENNFFNSVGKASSSIFISVNVLTENF